MTELENYFRVRTMTYRRALAAADDGCSKGVHLQTALQSSCHLSVSYTSSVTGSSHSFDCSPPVATWVV